jgi:ATP adenylyltransferase
LEIIWTPWRYEYVNSVDEREGCIFCDKSKEENDRENLVVFRGERCFAILNLFPYTTGHIMIAPYEHTDTIENLDTETLAEMMVVTQSSMREIRDAFGPEGFNLGINISRVAGAGIKDHVHLHLVPRWAGDNNFMAVIADTRVLPRTLDDVWLALKGKI